MTGYRPRWPETWVQGFLAAIGVYGLISLHGLVLRWGISPRAWAIAIVWGAAVALGWPLLRRAPTRRRLALLATVALGLRVASALLAAGRDSTGDPHSYLVLALTLLKDHRLGIWEPWFGGYWRALFPPLYPLLLAGWGAVGGFSTASLTVFHSLTDLVTAWLIWRFGSRLGRPGAGRGAAWLYLIWPAILFSAPLAQKESLCALLVVALASAWLRVERRDWRSALLIGALAALLALTQPGEAPLAALFGLAMIARLGWKRVIVIGISAVPFAIAAMLPWWVRNFLVLGHFVPLTTASGASLWIGNNPDATGNWIPPPPELRGIPELAYGKRIAALATTWIRHNPGAFAHLTLQKLLRACGVAEFGVVRLAAMRPALSPLLAATLWPLAQGTHLAMLGAATLGARVRRDTGHLTLVLIVAACITQWLLFGVWFEFGERHREFATPFLLLLACWPFAVGKPDPAP